MTHLCESWGKKNNQRFDFNMLESYRTLVKRILSEMGPLTQVQLMKLS